MSPPMTREQRFRMVVVLADVQAERERQHEKFGEQTLPDGTGGNGTLPAARAARQHCIEATGAGTVTWRDVLREEVCEALAEEDHSRLRAELLQVAAVACQWVEAIDRRKR